MTKIRTVGALLAVIIAATVTASSSRAQNANAYSQHKEATARLPFGGSSYKWVGDALLGVDQDFTKPAREQTIYLLSRNGEREEVPFSIPGAQQRVQSFASAKDRTIVLCGSAYGSDPGFTFATYIARISPDRKQQIITRTWPFVPATIALAPDGTIWTVGYLKDEANTRDVAYNILRRYDSSGKLLSSKYVSASGRGRQREAALGSFLATSSDRVGWLTTGGEYIEFSLDGIEQARFIIPMFDADTGLLGLAMSDNNRVVASFMRKDVCRTVELDRGTGFWQDAISDRKNGPVLAGFDGDDLVTVSPRGAAPSVIHWFKRTVPQVR